MENNNYLIEVKQKIIQKLENGETITFSDIVLWKLANKEIKKQNSVPLHKRIKVGIKDYAPLISMVRGFFE